MFEKISGIARRAPNIGGEDWSRILVLLVGSGFLAAIIAGYFANQASGVENAAAAVFISGCSLLIGVFLGFIFGIPRSVQQNSDGNPNSDAQAKPYSWVENTNLEQISDWLTKIIVGITLVQFDKIANMLGEVSIQYSSIFSSSENTNIAQAVILFFVLSGFLSSYLWTRIFMKSELQRGDQKLQEMLVNVVEKQDKQYQIDAQALRMSDEQLNANDTSGVDNEKLKLSITKCSTLVGQQIFQTTRDFRRLYWKSEPARIERTVPIFEALLERDDEHHYWIMLQLAYALKDMPNPDFKRAIELLNGAIEKRGTPRNNRSYIAEYNRAVCKIKMDIQFRQKKESEASVKDEILADLKVGQRALDINEDPSVQRWIQINKVMNNE